MDEDRDGSSFGLSPVTKRRVEASSAIMEEPADRIAYQHTILCQTVLPYRDPGMQQRIWERQQGIASLRIEAGAARNPKTRRFVELGLPYGSRPRLILTYLNSEALRSKSPRIEVEGSLTAFIRRIQDRPPTGPEIHRFKDQLSRLAAAMVRLAIDLTVDKAVQVDTKIIDTVELWLAKEDGQRVLWPSAVELSPRYFESLSRHAVPLDERAIAAIANSPLALDVYAWLAQRLHRVPPRTPQPVSWLILYEQFGLGFNRLRNFRAAFLHVLRVVLAHYPGAKVEADEHGLTLRNSPPPVSPRLIPVGKGRG